MLTLRLYLSATAHPNHRRNASKPAAVEFRSSSEAKHTAECLLHPIFGNNYASHADLAHIAP